MHIDLRSVLRSKLGRKAAFVPRFVPRLLEKCINAHGLNELLAHNHPKTGAEFCRGVFEDLDVKISGRAPHGMPDSQNRRVLIVSNHPLGGLDGMALIDFFANHYGGAVHFIVNDLLMHITPLRDVFVPVNKHGAQSSQAVGDMHAALAGDDPVLIFPAGLVSRLGDDGKIADLAWKNSFINMAIKNNRAIVPVWFEGENTRFFYRLARWRKKSGLNFNIEMIRLPRELFAQRGKTLTIAVGSTINPDSLSAFASRQQAADYVRNQIENLRLSIK